MPTDGDRLLTTIEVAALLQLPVSTLHNWSYVGKGPSFSKVGKHRRYRLSDVRAFLDETRVEMRPSVTL